MRLIRSRLAYIVLLLAAVAYAVIARSPFSELLACGFVFMPFATLLYSLVTLLSLRVTTVASRSSPRKGDIMVVDITVTNRWVLPIPYLLLYCTVDRAVSYDPADEFQSLEISLAPHETRHLEIDLLCRRHGFFTAGITSMAVIDYLRIFRLWRPIKRHRLLVYPSIRQGEGLLLEGLPNPYGNLAAEAVSFEYTQDTRDVRMFVPGDRFSHLHYPLSSRGLGLFTRELEYETAGHITLLYDLENAQGEEADLLAHLAVALVYDAADRSQELTILLGGEADETPRSHVFSSLMAEEAFETVVSSVKVRRRFSPRWLAGALPPAGGRLIILSACPSVALLSYAARAKEKGYAPVFLFVRDDKVDNALSALRVEHYRAGSDDNDPIWRLV